MTLKVTGRGENWGKLEETRSKYRGRAHFTCLEIKNLVTGRHLFIRKKQDTSTPKASMWMPPTVTVTQVTQIFDLVATLTLNP